MGFQTCCSAAMLIFAPFTASAPVFAQAMAESAAILPSYPKTASLILRAPLAIDVRIRSAQRIRGPESAGVPAGQTRFYVQADVLALIRGNEAVPQRVGYLVDVAADARGRTPKLNRERFLVIARTVAGRPGELQLAGADAHRRWTPELDALVRRITAETVRPDAPPRITGIGNAFHVPGSLPGEGETQVFLTTDDGRPVSLSILRRPGEETRWAVALSEIVDEAAGPPQRDTLLWYRLACGLPAALPERSLASLDAANAGIAREDYQFVRTALGPCGR
jgi:hypothetical protein